MNAIFLVVLVTLAILRAVEHLLRLRVVVLTFEILEACTQALQDTLCVDGQNLMLSRALPHSYLVSAPEVLSMPQM